MHVLSCGKIFVVKHFQQTGQRHFVAVSEFHNCKIFHYFHVLQKFFQILVPVEKAAGSVMLVLVVTEVVILKIL